MSSVAQLRFLAALGGGRPNGLFFAGDLGQRIFQTPFSWRSLGVDVRGRSRTLRINYRTSHQIRARPTGCWARRSRTSTANAKTGAARSRSSTDLPPVIQSCSTDEDAEIGVVGDWLADAADEGVPPNEIGVFVRSDGRAATGPGGGRRRAGFALPGPRRGRGDRVGQRVVGTMHLAKGLEFRAVAVMACDDEVMPLQARIETVGGRRGPRGGLRHRAAPAVRGVHPGAGPPAGDRRQAGVGVPGGFDRGALDTAPWALTSGPKVGFHRRRQISLLGSPSPCPAGYSAWPSLHTTPLRWPFVAGMDQEVHWRARSRGRRPPAGR